MSNTIKLKKYSDVIEEYVAGGVITPGMLVAYNSDKKVAAHNAKGGSAFPMFALEDELQGKGIDEAYAAGAPVQVWVPYRGDHVNALVTGAEIVAGDFLQSAGDGTLEAFTQALATAVLELDDGADNGFKITARNPGVAGNAINVKLIGSDTATAGSEVVAVDDTSKPGVVVITCTFKDTAAAESTIAQVVTALNGSADAAEYIFVEAVGTSSEAAFEADDNLAGGVDVNPGMVVAQALEAVNPAAATVRLAVRIV